MNAKKGVSLKLLDISSLLDHLLNSEFYHNTFGSADILQMMDPYNVLYR